LKQALVAANNLVSQQNDLILRQAKKIEKLEHTIRALTAAAAAAGATPAADAISAAELLQSPPGSSHVAGGSVGSSGSGRGGSASRRRTEALESAKLHGVPSPEKDAPPPSSPRATDPITVTRRSPATSETTVGEDWTTDSAAATAAIHGAPAALDVAAVAAAGVPAASAAGCPGASPEQRGAPHSAGTSPSDGSSTYSEAVSEVSTSPPLAVAMAPPGAGAAAGGPPKGLAARLAMGSQERRRLGGRTATATSTATATTSRVPPRINTNTNASRPEASDDGAGLVLPAEADVESPTAEAAAAARSLEADYADAPVASEHASPCAPFMWQAAAAATGAVYLFIAHDNPQVGGCALSSPLVKAPYLDRLSRPPI